MKDIRCRIGVDVGGTKIEAVAIARDGHELLRKRVATPQGQGVQVYHDTLSTIRDLIIAIETKIGLTGSIGVGIPGALSQTNRVVKNSNSTSLIGHPLDRDLQDLLQRPIRLANDANCFALSEAVDGAAVGADSVFGVILGTGTGGGIVIHGQVITGVNSIAGEWGHNPLPWPNGDELPGPDCYCGKQGCIESFLSGAGLQLSYKQRTGLHVSSEEISLRAEAGEPDSDAVLALYENRLARGLASVINLVDPEVIVLGGGLSNIDRLYHNVQDEWTEYIFSDDVYNKLVKAEHGDSSGVRGAAWLWSDQEIWK